MIRIVWLRHELIVRLLTFVFVILLMDLACQAQPSFRRQKLTARGLSQATQQVSRLPLQFLQNPLARRQRTLIRCVPNPCDGPAWANPIGCGSRQFKRYNNSAPEPAATEHAWRNLFDGHTLNGWQITPFGGQGEVMVKDGAIILEMGASMTGVTFQSNLPKTNYEFRLQAQRVDGNDFFCGVTFPVGDSHCSFIVGGWSGGVVGLSSLGYMDASENETTQYMEFESGRWYRIHVRVSEDRIETWIDDEQMVDVEITGRKVSTRLEVELNKPFGFATWETTAALRGIELRQFTPDMRRDDPSSDN